MYAIVDIESTGSNKNFDRIFDIAIIKHDGTGIVDEFQSFVNPGKIIPPFIEELTGISNAQVHDAPSFDEIADTILELTKDCVFVAHNVAFDYHFLRYEFKRLNIDFQRLQLCTVKLSQSAFPNLEAYSLGKLCEQIDIPVHGRHTAYGDTKATSILFERVYQNDANLVERHVEGDFSGIELPNGLDYEELHVFPEDPGILYFLNEQMESIYISDGGNVRKKCFDVLREASSNPTRHQFFNDIHTITHEQLGNNLIAKISRNVEVQAKRPAYNRVRKRMYSHGIYLNTISDTHQELCLTNFHGTESLMKAFMNKKSAIRAFKRVSNNSIGNDFPRGKEITYTLENGSERMLNRLTYPWSNFIIKGDGRYPEETSFVLIKDRQFVGYGFVDQSIDTSVHSLWDNVIQLPENEDIKRTINSYLTKKKRKHVQVL